MVVHKLSTCQQAWEDMKSTNSVLQKFSEFKQPYNKSENMLISGLRTVTDTIGSWSDENETVQVSGAMENMDPDFNRELQAGAEGIHHARGGRCVPECGPRGPEGLVWQSREKPCLIS